jgi:Fe-S-cluster-containing dehydrogenase component
VPSLTDRDARGEEREAAGAAPREGKAYWRSVERLLDSPGVDPALREQVSQPSPEFFDGADSPPTDLSRRTMLGLMGASFGLAGLAGCRRPVEHIVPYVEAPEGMLPGVARSYATTMPFGTSAYGVVVESHEGRPTKIEGNELHPSSRGAATSWMQAAILDLYDPDRGRSPLRRSGAANAAPEETTWEDVQALWDQLATAAPTGRGLAVLSEGFSSPTQARLVRRFRERFPEARFAVWEPAGDGNVFAGLERATGRAQRPVYDLEAAEVVVALDADLLLTESESLANARGFARGRRGADDGRMNRLYAVESALSVTGANADHRLRLASSKVGAFAAALAGRLGAGAADGADGELPAETEARVEAIAADLRRAGPRGLVAAGRRQPPAVHALAHRINQALGAVGATVTLHELADAGWGRPADLVELVATMRAGRVTALAILGGNPAYTAPGGLGFAEALGHVEHVVHLAPRPDETSELAHWYLPQSHFLESWGDARSADGTASVVQPLIAPLYDSRSAVELLALIAGAPAAGHDLVRETWGGDDGAWRRVLHDGLAPAGAGPAPIVLESPARRAVRERPAGGEGLELVFLVSPSVHDGRFANNAWLQEEPDPITRISWDNAALVSPATAAELGVESGDLVRLARSGGPAAEGDELAVEVPVWIAPGQADGTVALELGYGRRQGGRVGTGVGADAYRLRSAREGWWETGVTIERTGAKGDLAQTQEHWDMAGRDLVREADLGHYREHPDFAQHVHGPALESLWLEPNSTEGHQWGMTVDLSSCIGCGACVTACQAENNIPVVGKEQVARGREMLWLRVDRYYAGELADPEAVFQPVPCMHCENAPCEQVCPVAATVHDSDGLNAMVYNRCIGTRYCSNNCPYKVRRFNFFNYTKDTPELVQLGMNPDVTVRSRGVMEKCTYCVQRINEGKRTAKLAGRTVRDGEVRTACQQTCPAEAITFGNLNDGESAVRRQKQSPRNYALLAELNNQPRTTYLAKVRNPNPAWESEA